MKILSAVLLLVVLTTSLAQAQQLDPRFPAVGKSTFGVAGLYSPDAVLPNPEGINPAAQNELLDYKYPPTVELDYGQLRLRDGLRVNMGIANFYWRLSPRSTMRVSGYVTDSNRATIPIVRPLLVEHNGKAFELSYAYRVNNHLDVGVALVPYDWMNTDLTLGNQKVASGEAHSTFQGRVGLAWRHRLFTKSDMLHLGAVYGYESDSSHSHISGASVDQAFNLRVHILGVAYDVRPGTTLFWNRQRITVRGEGLNEGRPLSYWGLQQFFSKQLMLRLGKAGPGNELTIGYFGKKWEGYLSVADRAFPSTESFYGKGTLVFASVVRKL